MEKIYVKERSVQNMSYVIVNKYYGVKLDKKGKPMSSLTHWDKKVRTNQQKEGKNNAT